MPRPAKNMPRAEDGVGASANCEAPVARGSVYVYPGQIVVANTPVPRKWIRNPSM